MNRFSRWSLPLALLAAMSASALAQSSDSALDASERLFRRAITAAMDTSISQNADAGQVFSAIRSVKDKDLLPLFDELRQSKAIDNQIYGMVAGSILAKDSARVDLKLLLSCPDNALVGSAISSLITADVVTPEQLHQIITDDKQADHRAMAVLALHDKKQLTDRGLLMDMLKSDKDVLRYNAAVAMLDDPAQTPLALTTLRELSAKEDLSQAPVEAMMIIQIQKNKLMVGVPWMAQVASDEKNDDGLRYTAVAALLALKSPEGPSILGDMIKKQKDTIQQVKLGLISIQFADQLTAAILDPLVKSKSTLVRAIAEQAAKAARGADNTVGLVGLIKEGHPIVLDWSLGYTTDLESEKRIALRTAIINQANMVDGVRDHDYERAMVAAQKLLEEDGPAGRNTVKSLLNSDNRAVVESVLAGLYRSDAKNQSELVAPIWDGLIKTTSAETAANYAALILAREGHKEPLTWLPGMIMGGTVQGPGFRALAGWYYAKLQGQNQAMLQRLLAQ